MRKIIIAILLILCLTSSVFAQTTDTFYSNSTSLGGTAYGANVSTTSPPYTSTADGASLSIIYFNNGGGTYQRNLGIIYFDTSSLPDTATISSASLKLYGKYNPQNYGWTINFEYFGYYSRGSDWYTTNAIGTSAGTKTTGQFGDAYNWVTLNLSNVSNISKTSYTGFRIGYAGNYQSSPDYVDQVWYYSSGYNASYYPTLEVTYTTPPPGYPKKIYGISNATKVNGVTAPTKVNGL